MSSLFGSSQTTTGSSTSVGNQNQSQAQTGTSTPNEDPIFTAFRRALLPMFGYEFGQANKDLYGAPEQARFLGQQNSLFNSSANNVAGQLARRGALQSGGYGQALSGLATGRAANTANYFGQIPALNQQYKNQNIQNLLGMATNFLGRSPLGQTTSGTGTSTGQSNQTQNSSSTTQNNPSLFSDIGSLVGLASSFFNPAGALFSQSVAPHGQVPGITGGAPGMYSSGDPYAGLFGGPMGMGGYNPVPYGLQPDWSQEGVG